MRRKRRERQTKYRRQGQAVKRAYSGVLIAGARQTLLRVEREQGLIRRQDELQVVPEDVPQAEGFWPFPPEEPAMVADVSPDVSLVFSQEDDAWFERVLADARPNNTGWTGPP